MKFKFIFLFGLTGLFFGSCTFNETLIFNNDGSGLITIQMDASEALSLMGQMSEKEGAELIDTTFYFKDVFLEKKDSIAQLSVEEQNRLKRLEPYGVKIKMDEDSKQFVYDVFMNFKDVSEANNMFDVFNQISSTSLNTAPESQNVPKHESVKVTYSYKGNVFQRDAFVADKTLHQQELDSLKKVEMMLGGMLYKLNYTFPKKIKSTSQPDATFSQDRKTLYFQAAYLEYIKNPDLLDIEVVLEK